jgi:hypothetical protein
LSGNDLTGTLPGHLPVNGSLDMLLLSHNTITGSIPQAFFDRPMSHLDLSHNRLKGDVYSVAKTDMKLELKVNRLSGSIPANYKEVKDLNVLGGNLFQCRTARRFFSSSSDIPDTDPNSRSYSCGSDLLDSSMSFYLIVGVVLLCGAACAKYFYSFYENISLNESAQRASTSVGRSRTRSTIEFVMQTQTWLSIADAITYYRTGLLLASSNFKAEDSRFRHLVMSGKSLSELSKFLTLLILIQSVAVTMAAFILMYYLPLYIAISSDSSFSEVTDHYSWIATFAFSSGLVPASLFCFSWVVTALVFLSVVNAGYDYFFGIFLQFDEIASPTLISASSKSRASKKKSLVSIVGNAAVVIAINVGYLSVMTTEIAGYLQLSVQFLFSGLKLCWNYWGVPICLLSMPVLSYGDKAFIWTATLFFNNVFAPVIAAAFTAEGCFDELFFKEKVVSASYPLLLCSDFRQVLNACVTFGQRVYTAEHVVPAVYNFTCGTNVLVSFLPVLFYSYSIVSFIAPLCRHYFILRKPSELPRLLVDHLPPIFWPLERSNKSHLMNPHKIGHTLIGHLCILMTFGVLSPVLAVVVAATIVMLSSTWIGLVGRYADQRYGPDSALSDEEIGLIATNEVFFKGAWTSLFYSKWCVVGSAGLFYSIMLFDVAGRAAGTRAGVLFVFSTIAVFILFYVSRKKAASFIDRFWCGKKLWISWVNIIVKILAFISPSSTAVRSNREAELVTRETEYPHVSGKVVSVDNPIFAKQTV